VKTLKDFTSKFFACSLALVFSLSFLSLYASVTAAEPTKLYSDKEKAELNKLANDICSRMLDSQGIDGLNARDEFKSTIARYLSIPKTGKNTRKKVIDFLNANKEYFVCTSEVSMYSFPQTVLRRLVDMKIQEEVFFEFLLEDDSDDYKGKADLNVIHIYKEGPTHHGINGGYVYPHKGEAETLLDYIETLLSTEETKSTYNHDELLDLQESLRDEYGAKYVRYANKYPEYALDKALYRYTVYDAK
jgi:hypothetical protein